MLSVKRFDYRVFSDGWVGGGRLRDPGGCEKATGNVSYLGDTTVHLCKKGIGKRSMTTWRLSLMRHIHERT